MAEEVKSMTMTDAATLAPPPISHESKNWALFSHLSTFSALVGVPLGNVLGPLVMWLLRREQDPFAERHAREALNFNISLLLYGLALFAGGLALLVVLIGIALLLLALLYAIVFFFVWVALTITATMAASRGEEYRYPLTIRFVN
jgi:uncharacterized Tic20 family protein